MSRTAELDTIAPTTLVEARNVAHDAVRIAALAAVANVEARPDHSHAAMLWQAAHGGFQTGAMPTSDGPVLVRVTLSPLALWLVRGGETVATIGLEGQSASDCIAWLDEALAQRGLNPVSRVLSPEIAEIRRFDAKGLETGLQVLSRWYDLANHHLHSFAGRHGDITPGPGPVWCWPHHFDIATYVSLETGRAEEARGIGVGMSPGDENYGEPYFYINPWPPLHKDALPPLPPPGRWHLEGFVGAIATASRILQMPQVDSGVGEFIEGAFASSHAALAD